MLEELSRLIGLDGFVVKAVRERPAVAARAVGGGAAR